MATTQRVVIVDDLDGSTQDVQTVWIGLDGKLYEIDLSAVHRQQLRAALEPFTAHARVQADQVDDRADGEEGPAFRRPRPPRARPAVGERASKKVEAARTTPVSFEHPDYPWFPFRSAGPTLAGQVRAWAAQQGIPMPHRGIPRSVLLAYRRRAEHSGEHSASNDSGPAPSTV